MRHITKKGQAFNLINAGMIAFISFILISLLAVILVSQTKQTNMVCGNDANQPTRFKSGTCQACPSVKWGFNTTGNYCCNVTTGTLNCKAVATNRTPIVEYGGAAYNATKNMANAAQLPPQFAQIIVIVLIIVGILAMLAFVGYMGYQKMRR